MLHRGELVEKAVRESSIPITRLAKKLKKSRQYVYNLFDTPNVPLDMIMEIGKITGYDFSKSIPTINTKPQERKKQEDQNADYWRNKYIQTLEKYNELLSSKIRVVKR